MTKQHDGDHRQIQRHEVGGVAEGLHGEIGQAVTNMAGEVEVRKLVLVGEEADDHEGGGREADHCRDVVDERGLIARLGPHRHAVGCFAPRACHRYISMTKGSTTGRRSRVLLR